jgi:hypothetical protein
VSPADEHRRRWIALVFAVATFASIVAAALLPAGAFGLVACVIAAMTGAALAAAVLFIAVPRAGLVRIVVVLGATAYLAGLPVFWQSRRHVAALVGPMDERMWQQVFAAALVMVFATVFFARSASSRGPSTRLDRHAMMDR